MSGQLTTHVLDLSLGKPAAGMSLQLWRFGEVMPALIREAVTNSDGRLDAPLLAGEELLAGSYELVFMAGDYFRGAQTDAGGEPASGTGSMFLEHIPIRFNITDPAEHYHVPLLVAPGGYSTYRGS
ncbi:5-hydroxyisourate hydrolase [Paenibacillus sp. IHB B 3415]|uniref:hydroxyisourate hydrolase n=1 Tax=Paenibacillus sp. IHB B 3415 TaxID=867080 RepID=UPI0005740563|nr:hydroxyisourate hydrolase [Paenibacillus sp. IHB B 3415]KHL94391.1 5-hydroxyisourate hydrolase [Paenibacillus sp. IHB B 3415]